MEDNICIAICVKHVNCGIMEIASLNMVRILILTPEIVGSIYLRWILLGIGG